jgi:hypothetical protein
MRSTELEAEKAAVLERISKHRPVIRNRFDGVRRSFGPVSTLGAIFRTVLPLIRPVSGLARTTATLGGKGKIGKLVRVGLIASMVVPAARALWGNRDSEVDSN